MLVRRGTRPRLAVNAAGGGRRAVVDLIVASGLPRDFGLREGTAIRHAREWADHDDALVVFAEPLPREAWSSLSDPSDRAVVVLRDPRDLVAVDALRPGRLPAGVSRREALIASIGRLKESERMLRSWAGRSTSASELVTRYEDVAATPDRFVSTLADFLDVAGSRIRPTLFGTPTWSFDPDDGDRVGIWADVFDPDVAEIFEMLLPGLISELGYDTPSWPSGVAAEHTFIMLTDPLPAPNAAAPTPTVAVDPRSRGLFDR